MKHTALSAILHSIGSSRFLRAILYLHQLPQNLVGWVLVRECDTYPITWNRPPSIKYYLWDSDYSISLGKYILVSNKWYPNGILDPRMRRLLLHEYGHCRQSLMLGWLYLPVVGLPSMIMNLLTRRGVLSRDRYYLRWPENWADRLGGVVRRDAEL
jgi:hypothetical protein